MRPGGRGAGSLALGGKRRSADDFETDVRGVGAATIRPAAKITAPVRLTLAELDASRFVAQTRDKYKKALAPMLAAFPDYLKAPWRPPGTETHDAGGQFGAFAHKHADCPRL